MAKKNENVGTVGHVDHTGAATPGAAPSGDETQKSTAPEGSAAPGTEPAGAVTAMNQGGMTAEEIAALNAAKATAPDAIKDNGKSKKPPLPKTIPGLRIKAKVASFRRAGLAFGLTPVDVPLSELNKEQRAGLAAEPMLTVEEIEIEA
jgi:hypothetical protein